MRAPAAPAGPASDRARDHASAGPIADVYQRHADFVWRVVRRHGIPDAVAEDVMHEVFIVVHRRLHEYDGRASLTTWLYHLARGVVSNWKRGQKREAQRMLLLEPASVDAADDPERGMQRREAAAFVREFVGGLDEDRREVFALVELEGISVPEVAQMLGINLNTAYSRLRLARQAFACALERQRGAHGGGAP